MHNVFDYFLLSTGNLPYMGYFEGIKFWQIAIGKANGKEYFDDRSAVVSLYLEVVIYNKYRNIVIPGITIQLCWYVYRHLCSVQFVQCTMKTFCLPIL